MRQSRVMRAKGVSFLVLGLALGVSACGSDDPAEEVQEATPACVVSDEMKAAALAEYTVDGETGTPGDWAENCGRACLPQLNTDGYTPCVRDCIMEKTDNALSNECATCLVIPVECAVVNCLSECVADTPECTPCLCTVGEKQTVSCIDEYTTCSGLSSDTCEGQP